MEDIQVKSPVESRTNHNIDNPASHSRDWDSSVQVKSEQLQHRRPKVYNEDQGIIKHNDSSDSLVDAVAATGPGSTESELCIGHTTMSKSQNGLPHRMYSVVECITKPAPADDERLEFISSMPDSDDGHDMNGTENPLVFMVYSKYDDSSNYVKELADLLNTLGCNCEIDQYHCGDKTASSFWEQWVDMMIRRASLQNGFLIFVCSPTLHHTCCSMSSLRVEMKYGHINNQTLNSLIMDSSISSHVIPVFLEQKDENCIPRCLLRTNSYPLNVSKVFEVFAQMSDETDVNLLLDTPGLEFFRSFYYRLRGEQEFIKPPKSADIAALPSSTTSTINSQEMERLQSSHLPLSQAQFAQTPSTVWTPGHSSQQFWANNDHISQNNLHHQTQYGFVCQQFTQQNTNTPTASMQCTIPSHHSIAVCVETFKQLTSFAVCNKKMLCKTFVTIFCMVLLTVIFFTFGKL